MTCRVKTVTTSLYGSDDTIWVDHSLWCAVLRDVRSHFLDSDITDFRTISRMWIVTAIRANRDVHPVDAERLAGFILVGDVAKSAAWLRDFLGSL